MNWSDLPPLPALRAFSAFADRGNVVDAGAALNVSHAAISQQLRALERHMNVALLDRSGRSLSLTEDGRRLAQALELGFGAIGTAVRDLTGADANRPVHISVTATFATAWLMPRLPDLRIAHPQVDLRIDPSAELVTLAPGGIDVALRYGVGPWKGLDCELLFSSPIVVVAAPALLQGRAIGGPGDLADLPWLEELGTTEANNWLRSKGVAKGFLGGSVQMPGNLLLDAARAGQGVAVTVRQFIEPDIQAGRLRILFTEPGPGGYNIVTRPGVLRPPVKALVQWLRRQKDAAT